MILNQGRLFIALCTLSISLAGRGQTAGTLIRVLSQNGIDGIAGVLLVVNSGNSHGSQAFVTDSDGNAHIPHMDCSICIVTAIDPRGLFFDRTTEFDGQRKLVALTLKVRPLVERVCSPGSLQVNVTVYGPDGEPFSNQTIAIRPAIMTFDKSWYYIDITSSKGLTSAELVPGGYIVAALIAGKPWEGSFQVGANKQDSAGNPARCLDAADKAAHRTRIIKVRLSEADTIYHPGESRSDQK
jgi:hypothetical protein